MSSYQTVKVLEVGDTSVVLDVKEHHPDMEALHFLLTKRGTEYLPATLAATITRPTIPRDKAGLARNFAAQLLTDYGESGFLAALERHVEDDGELDPKLFIKQVTIRDIEPLKRGSNGSWLYRATVAIELKRPGMTGDLKPKRTYEGYACPTGDWDLP